VVYSVRGLSSTNHQSPITNHQSSIINHPASTAVWLLRLFGFSPEGGTRTAGVRKPPDCGPPNTLKSPEGDKWCKWSVVSGCSLTPIASSPSPASGCLVSIESLVGPDGLHTQKDAGLGLSDEFTFPLLVRGRRAADRLAELHDWSIGSFALGDTFGQDLGSSRGREARQW